MVSVHNIYRFIFSSIPHSLDGETIKEIINIEQKNTNNSCWKAAITGRLQTQDKWSPLLSFMNTKPQWDFVYFTLPLSCTTQSKSRTVENKSRFGWPWTTWTPRSVRFGTYAYCELRTALRIKIKQVQNLNHIYVYAIHTRVLYDLQALPSPSPGEWRGNSGFGRRRSWPPVQERWCLVVLTGTTVFRVVLNGVLNLPLHIGTEIKTFGCCLLLKKRSLRKNPSCFVLYY